MSEIKTIVSPTGEVFTIRDVPADEWREPSARRSDIPVPRPAKRYNFDEWAIGDSQTFKCGREEHNAFIAFSRYKAKNPGWDYVSQQQDDNTRRFWRIA